MRGLGFNVGAVVAEERTLPSDTKETEKLEAQYEMFESLGQGSASVVFRARRRIDDKEVALKSTRTVDNELIDMARAEYAVLKDLDHPNIIRVYDFLVVSDRAVLVMEYFDCVSLEKTVRMAPGRHLPESFACDLFRMLLQAIDYLHQRRVLHRDVKADNCLVNKDWTDIRLADFNVARRLAEGGSLTMTGTQEYAAPEVLSGESPSETSDIWSAGLCLHLMLCGQLPRRRDQFPNLAEFLTAVLERPPVLEGPKWQGISEPCKSTLRRCLEIRKSQRPAAMTILEDEWLTEVEEVAHMKSTPNVLEGDEDWDLAFPVKSKSFFR